MSDKYNKNCKKMQDFIKANQEAAIKDIKAFKQHIKDYINDKDKEIDKEIVDKHFNGLDEAYALHQTTDAQVWTDEFIKILNKLYPHFGNYVGVGEKSDFREWVFGWFCNAIQTGIDLTNNKRDKQYVYILQCNSGAIVKVWSHGCEPNERDMDVAYSVFNNLYDTVKGIAAINCTLYRWNRYEGLQSWNGKLTAGTKYNWK